MNRTEEPQHPMPIIDPAIALSTRQEAFCRHYAVSGNAADAARQAGCALPERHAGFDGTGPFNPPGDADFAPDHDKT
ncbi:MAG: hypothetical protein OXG99_01295 [Alphaproteobacteria bacterium]|nr:hypothetical protein [Alphaproteobacteria bacterium]